MEEIVQSIVSHRHEITREQIFALIEKKKTLSGGLLTNEAAARLVAIELGVEIRIKKSLPKIFIQQLVSGLNDVTVFGRVLRVYLPITFSKTDKSSMTGSEDGRMARLVIKDKTAAIMVLLWNKKADLSMKIHPGQIIKVSHGYVRLGINGKLELHIGERGDIQVASSDIDERDFPPIRDSLIKIADITEARGEVDVKGTIKSIFSKLEFKRKDGTQGKVVRMVLEDKTGEISTVFWNNKTEEITGIDKGGTILLMNAKVKKNRRNAQLELHVEDSTDVEILSL